MDDIFSFVSSVSTVVSFVTFIGIVAWAYSRRRREAFVAAANAPFALPDDGTDHIAERKS
jgi:cytochrome c oxidase cbb3-type subunit 4